MSGINRRQLLAGGVAALAATALPWWKRLALAQDGPQQQRNLLLVFVGGGWDVTASIDPKPGLTTIDSPPGDVRLFGNIPVLTGSDRPAVGNFFTTWGDLCAVVNGVEVRSIAHEECTKRILTGTNNSNRPDMGAIAGVENGADLAVPYMILGNTAFSGPYGGSTGRAGMLGQVITLLEPEFSYSAFFGNNTRFKPTDAEADLIKQHVLNRANVRQSKVGEHGLNKRRMDDFIGSVERRDLLRPMLSESEENDLTSQLEFVPQIDLALQLFKSGISRSVLIEHPGEWDTHAENNAQQLYQHQDLYTGLNTLMERLMREGLFESTTVVVVSEMSRTPKLNSQNGKDHWPVTSAMVLGSQVRGGQVYGGTDVYQNSVPTNLLTGKADDSVSTTITSAGFASGVLTLMGVDPEPYFPGVEPLRGFINS
ncbi:MAG: DUF1501 domain-containing protein [Myxococcota bacterium]